MVCKEPGEAEFLSHFSYVPAIAGTITVQCASKEAGATRGVDELLRSRFVFGKTG